MWDEDDDVSVLFNEPKLLKFNKTAESGEVPSGFSALQRAEIAEMSSRDGRANCCIGFSALQRAEIAEMSVPQRRVGRRATVSVLFNEPKLLK